MTEPPLRILCVVNDCLSPPGTLVVAMARHGAEFDEVLPHDGERLPADHRDYDGVIVLGGGMEADDDENYPQLRLLVDLLRGFHRADKPMLGICLGAQLFARVFQRQVRRHHEFEHGFTELSFTPAAEQDPVFRGLGPRRTLFEFHRDTFDLPADAVLLVTGERCPNQAFRMGRAAYAVQFHPETTRSIIRAWLAVRRPWFEANRPSFFAELEAQMDRHMGDQMAFCRTIGERWLDLVAARRRQG
jgi:GMP synthase-like glutamine amidotransferase